MTSAAFHVPRANHLAANPPHTTAVSLKGAGNPGMTDEKLAFINALVKERDGSTTDFEIGCQGIIFKVHRVIVAMHYQVFRRLCAGGFREAAERKVELEDDPLPAGKAMIEWWYTFDYTQPAISTTHSQNTLEARNILEAHSQVYSIADKHYIPGLANHAFGRFYTELQGMPAGRGNVALRAYLVQMAKDFMPATEHIYKSTPTENGRMRTATLRFWTIENLPLDHVDRDAFTALLAELPEFATDLVEVMTDSHWGATDHRLRMYAARRWDGIA